MNRKFAAAPLPSITVTANVSKAPNRDNGTATPDKTTSRAAGGEEAREAKLTRRKMLTILSTSPAAILPNKSFAASTDWDRTAVSLEVLDAIKTFNIAWQAFEDICPVVDSSDPRFDPARVEEGQRLDEAEVEARLTMLACPMYSLADFAAKADAIKTHCNGELGTLDGEFLDALLGSVRG